MTLDQDLFPEFLHNVEEYRMVEDNQKVLLAVSGGPDSMALLHLFLRWNSKRIGVWHLNHGFRESAAAEAEMVRRYCEEQGVPVEICTYDVMRFIKDTGDSKQQGARRIRYKLLEEYARARGYSRIALGHHADDQAETVLMHLLRGSGLSGLKGMLPKRGIYIRPLLTMSKAALVDYCLTRGIPFAEDESNADPVYFRNKVRHELIPLLEREYNRGLRQHLVNLSEVVRAEDEELEGIAREILHRHMRISGAQAAFPRRTFTALSPAMQRRVLRSLLAEHKGDLRRIGYEHVEKWRGLILAGGSFELELPQTTVAGTANYIYVGEFPQAVWESMILSIPGEVRVGGWAIRAELFTLGTLPPPGEHSEDFDLQALALPLIVRPRQDGDRMQPFGSSSLKKVSRLMLEAHVPRGLRCTLPLVADQQDILWIPEVRRGEKGRLSHGTKDVVRLTCVPGQSWR